MIIFISLMLSLVSFATDQDTFEKTYPRDNSFCLISGKRLEIMVRGFQAQTDPKERTWGEQVFTRTGQDRPKKIPVTSESGLYHFFPGNPSSCTKTIGTMIDGKFVVLFQRLNSPHKHHLIIQYIDPETLKALETVHTPYLSDKAVVTKGGIVFRTHPPARQDLEMGKVTITGKKYLYQDHVFETWVLFTKDGFGPDSAATFENFTYKSFFKTEEDFKVQSGWQETSKVFSKTKLYVATNHESKSKCILLLDSKKVLTGDEGWVCQ